MPTYFSEGSKALQEVSKDLLQLLDIAKAPSEHCTWRYELSEFDETLFLCSVSGVERVAFKSRDRDIELFGIGAADLLKSDQAGVNPLFEATCRAHVKVPGHIYFGASRFDAEGEIAQEWSGFSAQTFILPMLLVIKSTQTTTLYLNFRYGGPLLWPRWFDYATTLLKAVMASGPTAPVSVKGVVAECTPHQEGYRQNIKDALETLQQQGQHKVVLGRRKTLVLEQPVDPALLYARLKQRSSGAFLFFFDLGRGGQAFFGASPELLYRRIGLSIETESLAGTRARSINDDIDSQLGQELLSCAKDIKEHSLVSLHIEETLKKFGITTLHASKLAIMTLTYVQHLVKRYSGRLSHLVYDSHLIKALHPTPAVCGFERDWSIQFIRDHEGFDRGLYAGFIGFLGNDETEFAVGIRSALLYQQNLYVYAASGIVSASLFEAEWAELDNKEKSILCIFDEDR